MAALPFQSRFAYYRRISMPSSHRHRPIPTKNNRTLVLFTSLLFSSSLLLLLLLFFVFKTEEQKTSSKTTTGLKMSSLKIVDANLENFANVFESFKADAAKQRANLILFLADKDPSTNLSWCPDCVRAEPVIYKKLEASSADVALLRAYVGDRPTWRNPSHPWRIDPIFKLTGVPTLVRWGNEAIDARLEDHEAHIEAKINTLVNGE